MIEEVQVLILFQPFVNIVFHSELRANITHCSVIFAPIQAMWRSLCLQWPKLLIMSYEVSLNIWGLTKTFIIITEFFIYFFAGNVGRVIQNMLYSILKGSIQYSSSMRIAIAREGALIDMTEALVIPQCNFGRIYFLGFMNIFLMVPKAVVALEYNSSAVVILSMKVYSSLNRLNVRCIGARVKNLTSSIFKILVACSLYTSTFSLPYNLRSRKLGWSRRLYSLSSEQIWPK